MIQIPSETGLPRRTVLLNATSLKYSHCQYHYHMAVAHGWVDSETREELTFGKAVHKYAERRGHGDDHLLAITQACQSYTGSNMGLLSKACTNMPPEYLPVYVQSDGTKYIERKFKVFWQSIVYNEVQYDIYVVGTFDRVHMTSQGIVQIKDFKTTRRFKEEEVFAGYACSVQMQYYAWVAHTFAYHIFDMNVANAAHLGHIMVRIQGVFLSRDPVVWKEGSPIQYSLDQLKRFGNELNIYLHNYILPSWDQPLRNGILNDTCGHCPFRAHCYAATPELAETAMLNMKQVQYDPTSW